MGQNGGKRPGSGRKPASDKWAFRSWCRDVIQDPEVRALMEAHAKSNPDFALKIAEHGWGRPPQSLKVSGDSDESPIRICSVEIPTIGSMEAPAVDPEDVSSSGPDFESD